MTILGWVALALAVAAYVYECRETRTLRRQLRCLGLESARRGQELRGHERRLRELRASAECHLRLIDGGLKEPIAPGFYPTGDAA